MAGKFRLERRTAGLRTGGSGKLPRLRGCSRRLQLTRSRCGRALRARSARPRRTLAGAPGVSAQASSRRPRSRISSGATRFGACETRALGRLAPERTPGWRTSCVRRALLRVAPSVSCFRRAAPSLQLPSARTNDLLSSAPGDGRAVLYDPKTSADSTGRKSAVPPRTPLFSPIWGHWILVAGGMSLGRGFGDDNDRAHAPASRYFRDAAFSPSSDGIVTGGDDRNVYVWRADGTLV